MNDSHEIERLIGNNESLNPLQEKFRKKLIAINALQHELEGLTKNIETCSLEYRTNIEPLQSVYFQLIRQRIILLAAIYLENRLSKSLKRNLSEVISRECKAHLEHEEDMEIRELYERCCKIEYPENEFGEADGSFYSFEENYDFSEERKNARENLNNNKYGSTKLKSNAREEAKQEARNRSIKDIYKDLIKVFHPDKEMDESKKTEKEEISKKLTEAYSRKDLFTLLQLELLYMESNEGRLKELVNDKLKIYNEILEEQKSKLEFEIQSLKNKHSVIYKGMCSKHSNKNKFLKTVKSEWKDRNVHLKEQLYLFTENDDFLKYFVNKYLEECYMNE